MLILMIAAYAGPSVGAMVGAHLPSDRHELYDPREGSHAPLGPIGAIGIRAGYRFLPYVGVEGEALAGPALDAGAWFHSFRAHAVLRAPVTETVAPMLVAGIGVMGARSEQLGSDIDQTLYLGPALEVGLSQALSFRADARFMRGAGVGVGAPATVHTEVLVGLTYHIGARRPDSDGDGIPDDVDQCPNDAELPNGYRDEDGCPDELAQLEIKVKDAEGNLLRGVAIERDGQVAGEANRDGRLVIPDQLPETRTTFRAQVDGLLPAQVEVTLDQGDNLIELVPAWAPGTLVVTAKSLGGVPIEADIWAQQAGTRERWKLDANGRSERVLSPGVWQVMLASDGYDAIIKLIELTDQPGPRAHLEAQLRPHRIQVEDGQLVVLDAIQFKAGSAELSQSAIATIEALAATLVNHPDLQRIEISGHAASEGAARAAKTLSQSRADAARELLIARGVEASRLHAVGYGDTRPKSDEATPAAIARNRRIEFTVIPPAE